MPLLFTYKKCKFLVAIAKSTSIFEGVVVIFDNERTILLDTLTANLAQELLR